MNLIRKITATAALVALVSGLFTTGVSAASTADIENANKLANAGIINDHSSNPALYELNRNLLRQELAATVRGVAGIDKKATCDNEFMDVSATNPNNWACYTVEALRDADMIAANDYFRPEANVTNAEAIGMVVKACKMGYEYDSSNSDSWQKQVVDFAASKGIVENFSDYDALATRGFAFSAAANCVEEEGAWETDELICQLLGNCEENEGSEEGENTTPVVTGEDMLMVELSPETPADGNVAAGAARVAMLAFDVSAGNSDVTLKNLDLRFTGLGNSRYIKDLAVYSGLQKVTKGNKKFQSDDTADLTFEKNVVIKAWETKTLFVTATIDQEASNYNQTLQITLTDLEASSMVKGDNLVGSTLTPVLVSNVGKVELKSVNKITNTLNVGEVSTLAEFTLDETSDKEDVTVRSMTMQLDGSFDTDDLSDLALYADGTEIVASFEVKNSELEIELSHTIVKDKKVKFQLKGSVSGSVNEDMKIEFENDAIYAIGDSSNVSISIDTTNNGANRELADIDIEGSEINIAFNRNDKDEAKPGADDVELATVDLSAASDYTIEELTFTVQNNDSTSPKNIEDIVKTFELDGSTYDTVTGENTTTAVYTFEDLDLTSGEAKKLPLVMDLVNDTSIDGAELEITLNVVKVKDEDNNETYTSSSTPSLSTILSNNSFTSKTIEVKSASLEITSTQVNDTRLVLGNGVKTVLYKGKLSVGDADSIVLSDLNLEKSGDYNASVDVNDVISDVTLNIGGKTFRWDVETNTIEFNNINANIAAGADNVEMLVVATLKENDSITTPNNVIGFQLQKPSVDADDSEGDEVLTKRLDNANINLTKTTLNKMGTFSVEAITNWDHKDQMQDVVLAGTNSVNLGEVKLHADQEDAQVKRLTFEVNAAAAVPVPTFTAATTTANVPVTTAQTQVMTITIPTNLTGGTFSIDVDGNPITGNNITDLATNIAGTANVGTATVAGNVITVTAATAGTGFTLTNPQFNGSVESSIMIETVTPNIAASTWVASVKTLTLAASPVLAAGMVVEVDVDGVTLSENFNTDTATTLGNLATNIAGTANVGTATVAGNVITVTAATAGTDFVLANARVRTAGSTWDFSSTFKNVRIKDGSKTIADNAVLTFDGTRTLITFKDFTLDASNSSIDTMLVADLEKYDTAGWETNASLGDFTISAYTSLTNPDLLEVKGKSSQETYGASNLTATAGATEQVSIVPVILTVSVSNKLGEDDRNAEVSFTINKGNNTLDNDDVVVTDFEFTDNITGLIIRDDEGSNVFSGGTVSNVATLTTPTSISNWDKFEVLKQSTVYGEVRIAKNGVRYTVDSIPYTSSNDSILDLGTYSN